MRVYDPFASLRAVPRESRYFLFLFALGFLVKYNYALLVIYNVPSVTGLLLRNVVHLLLVAYLATPLVRGRKGRSLLLLILFVYTVIYFLPNLYYNRYFGNYLSYNDILMGQGFTPVSVLARQLLRPWDILFVGDLLLLGYLARRLNGSGVEEGIRSLLKGNTPRLRLFVLVLLLFLVGQVVATNRLLGRPKPRELFETSTGGFVSVYGVVPLYLYEIYRHHALAKAQKAPVEPARKPPVSLIEADAIDRNPNIVVIQMESVDAQLIGRRYSGVEVTPFLNELKAESLYASDFYAQHVNGSFDAEFAMFTSRYPLNKTYAFKYNDMSTFDSLIRILNENDYETMAFHGNEATFFHRHKAYRELGFDRFYSRKDFEMDSRVYEAEHEHLGVNDYDFLLQSLDHIASAPEPFFAFLITVTSHTTFNFYPESQERDAFEQITPALTRDYFNSVAFLDRSLRMFFSGLEERGVADNTLFLLYSDHDAAVESDLYSSTRAFETERPNLELPEHIPFFIKHEDVAPGVISKIATTTDIAPTILDLIGANRVPGDFAGSSVLHPEEKPVLFLHEVPQLFYKDHLFTLELTGDNGSYEVVEVGRLQNPREKNVQLTNEEKERALGLIEETREIIRTRRP